MKRDRILFALLAVASACKQAEPPTVPLHSERGGLGIERQAIHVGAAPVTVDPRRSLAVTDAMIVAGFSFTDVMTQLAGQGGVAPLPLFHQWWDSENASPGLGLGPHCNDTPINGQTTLNGFPIQCPRAEGSQAAVDPFTAESTNPNGYQAIGLFNRFDLAPTDGSDCGEYRMVFAKHGDTFSRNLIIFEAVLPNPTPSKGLDGCLPVAKFWGDLTSDGSLGSRATKLHDFYFKGLPGFDPVVHIDHYGAGPSGRGQIRSNQFMQFDWQLHEWKTQRRCANNVCTLAIVPATVKVNPFGTQFGSPSDARASAFQSAFVSSVSRLAINDLNRFNYAPSDQFNGGQSDIGNPDSVYTNQFASAPGATDMATGPSVFGSAIQAQLTALGSSLTPIQIVARAQALSCAGCHQLSNGAALGGGLTWPSSLGFVHVSEKQTETGPDGPRFMVSNALSSVFLPHRQQILETYLTNHQPCPNPVTCCDGIIACGPHPICPDNIFCPPPPVDQ
jgi:hypothetical protein